MKKVILAIIITAVLAVAWLTSRSPIKKSDTIVIALEGNPSTVDPVAVMDVHSSMVATAIHSPLAWIAQDGTFVPMVAEKLTMSHDALTLTITLKAGATFWDETSVTPADVVYSLERYRQSSNLHRWIMDRISGIKDFDEKVSKHIPGISSSSNSVTISFYEPEPDAALMLCNLSVSIVKKGTGELPAQPFGLQVIGCGPYAPGEFDPAYFQCKLRGSNPSKPAELVFQVISDDQARLDGFRKRTIDVLRLRGPMIGEAAIQTAGKLIPRPSTGHGKVSTFVANELTYGIINWDSPALGKIPTHDRREFNQAISYAIDRAKLTSALFPNGCAEPTASIAPPASGAPQMLTPPKPASSISSISPNLTLLAANDSASRQLTIALQKQLGLSGVKVETEFVDLGKLIERLIKKDYELMLFWIELQVPSSGPYAWCSFFDKNAPLSAFGEARDDTSALLTEARKTVNSTSRAEAFKEVVRLIDERQISWIPILSRRAIVMHTDQLQPWFDSNGTPVNGLITRK